MSGLAKLAAQEVLKPQGSSHAEGDIHVKALILYLAHNGVIDAEDYKAFIQDVIADAKALIAENPSAIMIPADNADGIKYAQNMVGNRLNSFVSNL
ncbi:hypothetical protein [Psychrobacter faecalis]|uniref:hypothetical protein n=1 Tax=Psychrobacter faecalis TaxID=180588 RepID=UPI0028AE44F7|nr:hypothetical protein [Psychrobacter faecalis]